MATIGVDQTAADSYMLVFCDDIDSTYKLGYLAQNVNGNDHSTFTIMAAVNVNGTKYPRAMAFISITDTRFTLNLLCAIYGGAQLLDHVETIARKLGYP